MEKQLLIEYSTFKPSGLIREGAGVSSRNMIVTGQVQACDKPNANKRIYPYDVLVPQVEKYIDGPIREKELLEN